jgi:hypothetical protein
VQRLIWASRPLGAYIAPDHRSGPKTLRILVLRPFNSQRVDLIVASRAYTLC